MLWFKHRNVIIADPDEGLTKGLLEYVMSRGVRIMYLGEVYESEKHRLYMESSIYTLPSFTNHME